MKKDKARVYICHTYYHAYIACVKELLIRRTDERRATILLSTMSNPFGNLKERMDKSGLFEAVYMYDEQEESAFPKLAKYHTDRGNLVLNMISRIIYTKLLGKYEAQYVPLDLARYQDIYVFCDSDPIGYYLSYKRLAYHALEDGLDCIRYYDTARYDNRGHFGMKAWMAARNLIFIQNGWSKYCLDMEVNDIAALAYPCPKYIECNRQEMFEKLSQDDKEVLVHIFIENMDELYQKLQSGDGASRKMLLLTEPLCDLETRKRIFTDIINEYGSIDGEKAQILIKPHPRDVLDYRELFPEHIVLSATFPMEILNYVKDLEFERVVSVFTVPSSISFAREKVFLGEDFMDKYEDPQIHRQNEQIGT